MPMGSAWKESTLNGPRPPPPNHRAVAPPLGSMGKILADIAVESWVGKYLSC